MTSARLPEPPLRDDEAMRIDVAAFLRPALAGWKWALAAALAGAALGYGLSYALPKSYTARTVLLPPQQQQSAAVTALASLSPLAGLSGVGTRSTADQYIALMRSQTVSTRIANRFELAQVYETRPGSETLAELAAQIHIDSGKRDGLITIEAVDALAERAAGIANAYVEELRRLTSELALTEAQQRRVFFEIRLKEARTALSNAQVALQSSGISAATIKSEPRAAAETYARLSADITALEVKLQTLRVSLADNSPGIQQTLATLGASRAQLARLEADGADGKSSNYMGKYRDLKYQEALVETFSRQYEAARLDEARDGTLIQVVDTALPPDHASGPRRLVIAAGSGLLAAAVCTALLLWRRRAKA